MLILKADTAVTLKIGPFIDDTDGNTLTIAAHASGVFTLS